MAGWLAIPVATWQRMQRDNLSALSAGAAFQALLTIFPTLTAFVSLYGLGADPNMVERQVATMQGVLPPEALRLLWQTRKPVTPAQLALGNEAWSALASEDPRQLAAIARSGTPALPTMGPVLHRQLCELPSVRTGLSLAEQVVLEVLAEERRIQGILLGFIMAKRQGLFWIGDLCWIYVIQRMEQASEAVLTRSLQTEPPDDSPRYHWLTITDLGRAVLRGERDWLSLRPPARWVGGVHIQPGVPGWRWDEAKRDAVLRES